MLHLLLSLALALAPCAALFQMPSTIVCARLGAPLWLSLNMAVWGGVAALFALARSVPLFLGLRFLLGAAESAAFPGACVLCDVMRCDTMQFCATRNPTPARRRLSALPFRHVASPQSLLQRIGDGPSLRQSG